jgi:cytidine deaminase
MARDVESATDLVDDLVARATAATRLAYAPYSRFQVGAALLTTTGAVFTGVNVENRSYPMSMCAERVAVGAAVAALGPEVRVSMVAVVAGDASPCAPCGGCRQVLTEFGAPDGLVVVYRTGDGLTRAPLSTLLPGGADFLVDG